MQSGRLLREESERSGLVDALLYGRLLEKWAGGRSPTISGCHRAARMSLLPAKRSSATLRPSRRRIELRSLDVYSGWRLPCPAFETFRVWLDNNGTLCATGELLICHPNTEKYRLRRIEQHTELLLCAPRAVAQLALALEVHRRLM